RSHVAESLVSRDARPRGRDLRRRDLDDLLPLHHGHLRWGHLWDVDLCFELRLATRGTPLDRDVARRSVRHTRDSRFAPPVGRRRPRGPHLTLWVIAHSEPPPFPVSPTYWKTSSSGFSVGTRSSAGRDAARMILSSTFRAWRS